MMAETGALLELDDDVCVARLRSHSVGRIAFLAVGGPHLFPVNYRFVERAEPHWILIRTRHGSELGDLPSGEVAFEIDSIDPVSHTGWSVVALGTLHHLDEGDVAPLRDHFDPEPWVPDRNEWLVVKCSSITGRQLVSEGGEWPFHSAGYL
jgi:nitroimidazol reductase NimA-like FMN-containing flavoprotein (pyridoxamine 5'-phosphate oxidase superfamily)